MNELTTITAFVKCPKNSHEIVVREQSDKKVKQTMFEVASRSGPQVEVIRITRSKVERDR